MVDQECLGCRSEHIVIISGLGEVYLCVNLTSGISSMVLSGSGILLSIIFVINICLICD